MAEDTPDEAVDKTGKKAKAAQRDARLRAALRENMHRRKSQKRARLITDKDEQDG